jgi:hypothetical protein
MAAAILGGISTVCKIHQIVDKNDSVVKYIYWKTFTFLVLLSIILPSEKTAQYMAGAYLIQSSYESEFVQTATPLAQQAILNQLKTWAKDNKELDVLVGQMEVVNNVNPK